MDTERWREISRLYHEALRRSADERRAFLDDACREDHALRDEVESLVAHEATAEVFLRAAVGDVIRQTPAGGQDQGTMLKAGVTLGGYRVERQLGRGGMGTVFLAYDTRLHRQVALKVIEGSAVETSQSRLLREARNAAALNHPNICTIHEIGEANGTAFIAMEYAEGRSLRERLDESRLSLEDALRFGIQGADALAYAHDHNVVHRDFKAANAIVTEGGRLKIVDFGLAHRSDAMIAGATTMATLVPAGAAAGTPYAMAPEQVRGEAADARTDIWALGVLLYEMLSGVVPFAAATGPQMFSSILRDAPTPLPDEVPAEVRSVVERCLAKEPEKRYQDARDVGTALEAIVPERVPAWMVLGHRICRRPWLVATAALVLASAGVVGVNVGGLRDRMTSAADVTTIKLAVLPFENLTGDPQQDDFSDGLTSEMITQLGRLRPQQLSVISRTSSTRYKQSAKPLDQIGRELSANIVLKASVARSGDRVRIAAELVETSNGRPLWNDTYERGLSDLVTLEHEISNAVASASRVQLAEPEKKRLGQAQKMNPEAYDLYLRGLSHALLNNEHDIDQAIALLEQSASLDPTFVPTQAYLALTYGNKSSTYRPNDPQWEEKGFAAAQKALNLDADAPEAHYAQAMMIWRPSHSFPSREALGELRKAVAARPDFDEAWHQRGVILFHVGHLDAGARDIERSLDINPGNTLARFRFGPIYVYQQKFEDAIAALNRVPREAFPAQWAYQRAWALISMGRLEEAGRFLDGALKDNPVDQGGVLHAARAMLRSKRGDRSGAEADIAEAIRAGRNFIHFHHTAYTIGAVYAALGELDKAQEWIENAANDGFPNYTFFESDVHLAPLRANPRFRAFLSKLRLEWEHIPGEPQ